MVKRVRPLVLRIYNFLYNEAVRLATGAGTTEYLVGITGPRSPSQQDLGTTIVVRHYPQKLGRSLGLPARLYAIWLYPDKIAQETFRARSFNVHYRPDPEEERDFINGLIQVDLHERLHVSLREEGFPGAKEEGAIESLENRLAWFIFPEYGVANARPWHSHRCPRCSPGRSLQGGGAGGLLPPA
jgi:hypothetical protein